MRAFLSPCRLHAPLLHRPLPDAPPPHVAHARLARRHATTFLLESREGPERLARHSILGFSPAGTLRLDADGLHVDGALPSPSRDQDPLTFLRRLHAFYATDDHATPFVGGLVGTLGHDFVRTVEPLLERSGPEAWPRMLLGLYLDGLVYDHAAGTATYVSRGADRGALLEAAWAEAHDGAPETLRVGPLEEAVPDPEFEAKVRDAQEQIRAGECFQIVLSRAVRARVSGDTGALYARLRDAAPVPYLYHLRFGGQELLGASPEMLVRVRGRRAETFPIAGTRPLTGDAARDARLGQELCGDRKERAEHAMLVDLARNDLARVCRPGTVRVEAFQQLHAFRGVQHLVSHVTGELADGQDALAALAAVFPAGTVSGAPKLRALEHIDRIEGAAGAPRSAGNTPQDAATAVQDAAKAPRGAYAGAVLYHSFNGDLDSAIQIRSGAVDHGVLTVQAGAGITVHSDPAAEAAETRHKMSALLDAVRAFQEDP